MDGMEKQSRRFRTLIRPRLRLAWPGFYFLVVIYYEELFLKLYCLHGISPVGALFTLLFTGPIAMGLGLLCGGVSPGKGRVLLVLCTGLISLWLGAQALIIALFFLFKSSTLAAIAAVVVFLVLPQVWYLLANLASAFFWQVYGVMLTAPFEQMTGAFDWAFCGRALAIGAGWFVISTAVGLVGFQRREIN